MAAVATKHSLYWFGTAGLLTALATYPPMTEITSKLAQIVWLYFVTGARG